MKRLAIVTSHPIQNHSPWFRKMAEDERITLKVFYTLGEYAQGYEEKDFKVRVKWKADDLLGYDHVFLTNTSHDPDSLRFWGINVPDLYDHVMAFQPNAVLIFPWKPYSHLKLMMKLKGKVPVLFRGDSTALHDHLHPFTSLLRYQLLRWVYRHVVLVLSPGTASDAYFKRCGLNDAQIVRSVHAVDNERFMELSTEQRSTLQQLRNHLRLTPDHWVYLYAGKFIEVKNILLLLNAFHAISRERSEVRLVLAGGGPLEAAYRTYVEVNKLSDQVLFIPHTAQENMPAVYRLANVFVLPSKSETWGLSINEALASGIPVIASDGCGACGNLLQQGINGMVFQSNNVRDLIIKMNDIRSPSVYATMQEQAKPSVQEFSIEQLSASVLNSVHAL